MMKKIRLVQEGDQQEWLRLRCQLWPDTTIEEHHREMLDILQNLATKPVFVAQIPDGALCGLLEVEIKTEAEGCSTDKIGYLEGWYVDQNQRRQGVGRLLVEAAETWAKTQGCTEMASDTDSSYPISPLAHQKLGYQEVTTVVHYRKDLH